MFIILPFNFLYKTLRNICVFTHCFDISTQETTESQNEGEQFLDSTEIQTNKTDEMTPSVSTNDKQNHI